MIRHCLGEDLKVGCNLTWGPCFDYQMQFFTGKDDEVSRYPYLLRYDIEVSGFGSHRTGHLCLLRLKERNYPGGDSNTHWPTLGLNTLRWAKKQGAITGPAHSGSGLARSQERVDSARRPRRAAELRHSAIQRHRGQRVHRRYHARGARPRRQAGAGDRLHLDDGHQPPARAQHVVPHAQLRLPRAGQRRDRFSLHLRPARRHGPRLCEDERQAELRRLVRGHRAGPQLRQRRHQPPDGVRRGDDRAARSNRSPSEPAAAS